MDPTLRLRPVTSRLLSRLRGNKSVADRARERLVLAPADEHETQPAISLPNEFERALVATQHSSLENERLYVFGARIQHGPTTAYRIENAFLADGTLYFDGGYDIASSRKKRAIVLGTVSHLHDAQLCTYAPANIYFGHWLRDALAMELLAEQRGLPALSYAGHVWKHERGYRELTNLRGFPVSQCTVDNLWVIDDRGLNSSWVRRFQELRSRIRANTTPLITRYSAGGAVYLTRGKSGDGRQFVNEEEIGNLLAREGFQIIEPERCSANELAFVLSRSQLVLTIEGSALNHAQMAMKQGSGILTIQPPNRFNAFHKLLTDFSRIRFGYVVGDAQHQGYSVNPDRLMRTVSLMYSCLG